MENGSYVYLFRKFGRCEWYTDVSAKVLFIHCLIKANWRDKESHGTLIKRGTFLTSIRRLSHETGLTDKQVRGGLSRLEKAEAIIYKPAKMNSIIVVLNYDKYQNCDEKQGTQKGTPRNENRAQQEAHLKCDKNPLFINKMNASECMKGTQEDTPESMLRAHKRATTNNIKEYNTLNTYAQIAQSASDCDTQNSGVMLENAFDRENAFNEFWKAYPKKRDKKKSHIKFLSVCKNEQVYQSIMDGLERQVTSADWLKNNGQYIPYPTTWLNGERWNDEVDEFITSSSREIKAGDW